MLLVQADMLSASIPTRVDSDLRGRTLRKQMHNCASHRNERACFTRRKFLGISLPSGAALLTGTSDVILGASTATSSNMATNPTFNLGGDFTVNRLGFGAMRVTGKAFGVGRPIDRRR